MTTLLKKSPLPIDGEGQGEEEQQRCNVFA